MATTLRLEAANRPQRIPGTSITIIAPGLRGQLVHSSVTRGRSVRAARNAAAGPTEAALDDAGLTVSDTLDIAAPTPPKPAGRRRAVRGGTDAAPDELQLDLSARPDVLFAIYRDEAGVVSFHFAERPSPRARGAVRGERGPTIVIPLRVAAPAPSTRKGVRGVGGFARKLIELIVRKVAGEALKFGVFGAVQWWENTHRAAVGFHGGTPAQLLAEKPAALGSRELRAFAGKPTLLFIHGTTSSTSGAFRSLGDFGPTAKTLWSAYDQRVVGFNHHTLTKSVAENVIDFFDALPPADEPYLFDAIVHSRGGIVARTIAALGSGAITAAQLARLAKRKSPWTPPANVRVQLRRIVFVGTPNNGTDLADPQNLPKALNWFANLAEHLPGGALTLALGAVLSIVALVAESGLKVLPGLVDQAVDAKRRTSDLLTLLNGLNPQAAGECFGIEARFRPAGALLAAALAFGVDAMFRKAGNDLVVPTQGISRFGSFTFTPASRVKAFGPDDGLQVYHTSYFDQPATWEHIQNELNGQPIAFARAAVRERRGGMDRSRPRLPYRGSSAETGKRLVRA